MLQLVQVSVRYGDHQALNGVSATIPQGRITILAGADGAGKSSLIRMLIGLAPRTAGQVRLRGQELGRNIHHLTGITGYMPERFSLYADLSVEENLLFFARIHGLSRTTYAQRSSELLGRTGMEAFTHRRAGQLSGGMKQKLALSCILLAAPELILLDEPTTGVDPLSRIEFFSIIEELRNEGRTVVLATPYLDEAERGDRVLFLQKGVRVAEGEIDRLKAEFPARLWDIRPQTSGFELLRSLANDAYWAPRLYQRGAVVKYLQTPGGPGPDQLPIRSSQASRPTLEDIYLYHDRLSTPEAPHV